eukprot:gene9198-biopygen18189
MPKAEEMPLRRHPEKQKKNLGMSIPFCLLGAGEGWRGARGVTMMAADQRMWHSRHLRGRLCTSTTHRRCRAPASNRERGAPTARRRSRGASTGCPGKEKSFF